MDICKHSHRYSDHCNEPPHPSPASVITHLTSSIPATPHQIILINGFFPNLFLTNPTHKSQTGFAHCYVSFILSPENSPVGQLTPETGNHHNRGFQLENTGQVGKEARSSQKEANQYCSLVMQSAPGWYLTVPAQHKPNGVMWRVYVFCRLCLIKGWFMFPGAGVSFYFCAVISPLKVPNSSALFESTHPLLFLVCEWPEIVSIVIDLNFHFDDGNK